MIYTGLLIFAHLQGITDAILYSKRGAEATNGNEHIYLVLQRICVALIALNSFGYCELGVPFYIFISEVIAATLAYSFFHNRSYYLFRDYIDGTSYGPRHKSPTSTAVFDFSYKARLIMFILSIVILISVLSWYLLK